jgi:hypothetical protein
VQPLTSEELASLRKSNYLWDRISNGFFKSISDMFAGERKLTDELLSSVKSLHSLLNNKDVDTTLVSDLQKRIGDLILELTQKRKANFQSIEAWVGKNVSAGNVKSRIQGLQGYDLAKSVANGSYVKEWNQTYKKLMKDQDNIFIQLNSVFNPFAWFGKGFRERYVMTQGGKAQPTNYIQAAAVKWNRILYGDDFYNFRVKFPLGLPKPTSAYVNLFRNAGIRPALWEVTKGYIEYWIKMAAIYGLFDLLTDIFGNLVLVYSPENEWAREQVKHLGEMTGNKTDEKSEGVLDDLAVIAKAASNYFTENLFSIESAFPGFADDVVRYLGKVMIPLSVESAKEIHDWWVSWGNEKKQQIEQNLENAEQGLEESGISIDTLKTMAPELGLDTTSTNVNEPDNQEPTPTDDSIQKGTASNEDKISLRDYLNNPEQFKKYTSIDKGEVEGTIITRFVDINGDNVFATIYKDSGGVWRYKKSNNPLPKKEN